jgi:hypothetical protein
MDRPDSAGRVYPTGAVRGGHEYLWHETYQPWENGLDNSWSRAWGLDGGFRMSNANLYSLIDQQGGDVLCMTKKVTTDNLPPDLDPQYATQWARVRASGLFLGYDDGTFKPDEVISVAHMTLVFGRAFALDPSRPTTRLDVLLMMDWWLRTVRGVA